MPQRYMIVLYDTRPLRRLLGFLRRNRVKDTSHSLHGRG